LIFVTFSRLKNKKTKNKIGAPLKDGPLANTWLDADGQPLLRNNGTIDALGKKKKTEGKT
jgi:hypothetical protein